jgi:hypothetical protein
MYPLFHLNMSLESTRGDAPPPRTLRSDDPRLLTCQNAAARKPPRRARGEKIEIDSGSSHPYLQDAHSQPPRCSLLRRHLEFFLSRWRTFTDLFLRVLNGAFARIKNQNTHATDQLNELRKKYGTHSYNHDSRLTWNYEAGVKPGLKVVSDAPSVLAFSR